ncbi:MAG: amine oxidase [Nocardioidaceae bacterium]|nr:amine oxidase [Nocardioidaceae bacterium]
MKVAVVGAGVSGLTSAYILRSTYDVTLFEANDRLGGHAHTHTVAEGAHQHRVDSGFIVHNDRTYPYLRRLFAELDIAVHPTEMSMSIRCEGCGLEYAGGRGAKGIFAQKRRVFDPRYVRMLLGVKRFQRLALAHIESGEQEQTYGDFLREHDFDEHFVNHYAIPVVSCVWSSGHDVALDYPAGYLFSFLKNHGFLSLKGSPQWFTVVGGSGTYVDKLRETLGDVRVSAAVTRVTRHGGMVDVETADGAVATFDKVIIATHADEALALLGDATGDERRVLGSFDYSPNETTLHRDPSLLPRADQAKAAWNYRMADCSDRSKSTVVTYWMNRLQGIASERPFLVTLNAPELIDPETVVATMNYTHPIYTSASVAAQGDLANLTTPQTAFAGAYHGWGFHEDGCRSGVEAARAFGVDW